MNLDNFEDFIDLNITEKGREYYESNLVINIEELSKSVYKAEVQGTNIYQVLVHLNTENDLISAKCNCAYNSIYCKHIIAVFYELRDMLNGNITQYRKKTQLSLDKSADTKQILMERTKEELVEFIVSLTEQYEELSQQILLSFFNGNDGDEIILCKKLIDTYISQNSDKEGFVSYYQSFQAVKGAKIVLGKAKNQLAKNKYYHSVEIVLCVVHELMKLLQYSDDSGWVIDSLVHESLDLIEDILTANENICSAEKQKLFYKLLEESSNRRYDDRLEYRLNLMEYCVYMAVTPDLQNLLKYKLNSLLENNTDMILDINHLKERVNLIIYSMIEKYDDTKNAKAFIEEHLGYPAFRRLAINNAFKNKDYELVIKLALEGEEQHKKLIGLVREWRYYRYDAYKLSGQLDNQRNLALNFVLDGDFKYYSELKNTYKQEEWKKIYTDILKLIEDEKKTFINSYTSILVEEKEFKKLLNYVKANPSSLILFYNYLIPDFKNEVFDIFKHYILDTASKATSRKDYHVVCNIIKKLSRAGGEDTAKEIIKILLSKYIQKPAFKDELLKIQLY